MPLIATKTPIFAYRGCPLIFLKFFLEVRSAHLVQGSWSRHSLCRQPMHVGRNQNRYEAWQLGRPI